jgi:hypothetical protein
MKGKLKIIKKYFFLKPWEETALEYPLKKRVHYSGSKIKAFGFFIAVKELVALKINFCSFLIRNNF